MCAGNGFRAECASAFRLCCFIIHNCDIICDIVDSAPPAPTPPHEFISVAPLCIMNTSHLDANVPKSLNKRLFPLTYGDGAVYLLKQTVVSKISD